MNEGLIMKDLRRDRILCTVHKGTRCVRLHAPVDCSPAVPAAVFRQAKKSQKMHPALQEQARPCTGNAEKVSHGTAPRKRFAMVTVGLY